MKHTKINKIKKHQKVMDSKLGHKLTKVAQKSAHELNKMKGKSKTALHHKYPKH